MDTLGENSALATRARNATLAAWAVIGFTAAYMVTEVADGLGLHDPVNMSEAAATVYLVLGVGLLVVYLASVVLVAMWIHRAHANLHAIGLEGLEFTPGWAVGWYFVPFANLIKPFQAMRELWNTSTGLGDSYSAPAPDAIKFWWGTWIVGNILSNIASRMVDPPMLQTGAIIGAISSALTIVCAWLLIKLIREITQAQNSRMHVAEVFD